MMKKRNELFVTPRFGSGFTHVKKKKPRREALSNGFADEREKQVKEAGKSVL